MLKIPTNTDLDGCAVCIKSNYFKMGVKNFQPQVGGKYAASGVMEIVYEEESFTNEPDAGWNLQDY